MADQSSEASTDCSESSSDFVNQPKKVPMTKTMEPKPKPDHPTTAVMVIEAIEELAERSGSSLRAIKKFISEKYSPITELQSTNIKKFLKKAVADGLLVQPKGKKGTTGSFKMPSAAQRKIAKAAMTTDSEHSAATKKYSKTSFTKLKSPSKKPFSTKTASKSSSVDHKKKSVKAKVDTKRAPINSTTKKMMKSPTRKPKIDGADLMSRGRVVY